jgi:hypothetical protein
LGGRVMAKDLFFATIALVFITSGALGDGHAITPDESLPYATVVVGTREICTTRKLVAGVRTECRTEALPVERPSLLKGICITSYGNRICY